MTVLTSLLAPPPTRNRAPLPATGRAGRNLPAAVGVAVVLIGAVLVSLLFYRVAFVGSWSWRSAVRCGNSPELSRARASGSPLAPLWLGSIGMAVCAWTIGAEAALGAYLATAGAVCCGAS